MILSLVGLAWVQVYLLRQAAQRSAHTFDRNVKAVMHNVSEDIVFYYLQQGVDRVLDTSINENRRVLDTNINGNRRVLIEVHEKTDVEKGKHLRNVDQHVTVETLNWKDSTQGYSEQPDSLQGKARFWANVLVEEMLEKKGKEIWDERIAKYDFDSSIHMHLANLDLPDRFGYRIEDREGKVLRASADGSEGSGWYSKKLSNSLMPHAGTFYLRVDGRGQSVFKHIMGPVVLSALFVLLAAGLFIIIFGLYRKEKEVSEARDDFINSMSHELKTPLATIALSLENIGSGTDDKRYVSIIKEENKRMQHYVENILQLARLDQTEFVLDKKEEHIGNLVKDVVRTETMRVAGAGGEIVYHGNGNVVSVIDGMHIRNVLHNLIDNGMKYADAEPRIEISVNDLPGFVEITVSDNGIGIEADQLERVFDKFYRVKDGNLYRVKGTGVGLSYSRMIVELHGGSLQVESEPGKGSKFIMRLPVESE